MTAILGPFIIYGTNVAASLDIEDTLHWPMQCSEFAEKIHLYRHNMVRGVESFPPLTLEAQLIENGYEWTTWQKKTTQQEDYTFTKHTYGADFCDQP